MENNNVVLNTKTVLNTKNENYKTGDYKAFLGDDLGLNDNINIRFKDIKEMQLLQRSQFWTETEVDLSRDRQELSECSDDIKNVLIYNMATQWLIDSAASRSIIQTFGNFVSNTEVQDLLMTQSFFEVIHAVTYSEIFRVCFDDPNAAIEDAMSKSSVIYRTKVIGEVFNETNKVSAMLTLGQLDLNDPVDKRMIEIQLLKNLAVLYGLEAISFMGSFACTFAITSSGKFQGIDKLIGLICRDEVCHAEGDRLIFKAFKDQVGQDVFDEAKPHMQLIFERLIEQELAWSKFVFSEGRSVLGLTEGLLKDYVYYIGKPCFDYLGLDWKYPVVKDLPLPYMSRYTNPDEIQVAPQELEVTNYRVGSVSSDLPDEFDF